MKEVRVPFFDLKFDGPKFNEQVEQHKTMIKTTTNPDPANQPVQAYQFEPIKPNKPNAEPIFV